MTKFEKHPNPKLRRNYKDMISYECTVECLEKYISDNNPVDENTKSGSSRLGSKLQAKRTPIPLMQPKPRLDTPEQLNISI